jgi:hypothetical protein
MDEGRLACLALHEWALHHRGHSRPIAKRVRARRCLAGAGWLAAEREPKP